MMESLSQLLPIALKLPGLLMVLFRLAGLMIMAPFFGSASVPVKVRVGLTLVIAFALWPVLPQRVVWPISPVGIAVAIACETLIGLLMGLAITTIFSGLQLAGTMIGQQMGIALADVFNPAYQDNDDLMGVVFFWMGLMVFLAIGGHRMLMSGLLDSFRAVPLGGFAPDGTTVNVLTGMLAASFVMAFKMALPTVLALFLVAVAMGLINRTVPQLNILTAGFPLRAVLGLLVLAATVTAAMRVFGGTIENALWQVNQVIGGLVA
ncbi:MAG: hypothetical protein BIFFINMI_03020 [Phycisphaerae bacterium]|nr:hypothetical protein [Phycisphaerae bacterium]